MSTELVVTIKDEERRLTRDFLIYEPFTFVDSDPTIMQCVKETIEEFKGQPEDIKIKATMIMR